MHFSHDSYTHLRQTVETLYKQQLCSYQFSFNSTDQKLQLYIYTVQDISRQTVVAVNYASVNLAQLQAGMTSSFHMHSSDISHSSNSCNNTDFILPICLFLFI